jgi:hypothetical protein
MVLLGLAVVAVAVSAWFAWRLATIIREDGYGFLRASSGLPRDWAPPELPSTPYSVKPHR